MNPSFTSKLTAIFLIALSLTACSPKFDWREVQGGEAPYTTPYTILMPGKPAKTSRTILLGSHTVTMQMTGLQIDGVHFVVGAVRMPDEAQANAALGLIKKGLLANLGGVITSEQTKVIVAGNKPLVSDEFTALSQDHSTRMSARLIAHDVWVFQVLVVGADAEMDQEAVEMFLGSFRTGL
jgi:hypothetical protein